MKKQSECCILFFAFFYVQPQSSWHAERWILFLVHSIIYYRAFCVFNTSMSPSKCIKRERGDKWNDLLWLKLTKKCFYKFLICQRDLIVCKAICKVISYIQNCYININKKIVGFSYCAFVEKYSFLFCWWRLASIGEWVFCKGKNEWIFLPFHIPYLSPRRRQWGELCKIHSYAKTCYCYYLLLLLHATPMYY
jgi:hypothetical protein